MPSIREIARLCGVSTSTVSNVLHGRKSRVGPETRERVLAAIREIHYRPPAFADVQNKPLTMNLGVLVDEVMPSPLMGYQYFTLVLDGILAQAATRSYTTTIFNSAFWEDPDQALRRSYDGRCDGMIVVGGINTRNAMRALKDRGTPVVTVGRHQVVQGVSNVDVDNRAVSAAATRHLASIGHSKIAFVGHDVRHLASAERYDGYCRTLRELGLELRPEWVVLGPIEKCTGEVGAEQLLEGDTELPTAAVCVCDTVAMAFVDTLKRRGVSVPDDVSVVGVDDVPESAEFDPPLTTIRQPLQVMGKRAVQQLLNIIDDPDFPCELVTYAFELVERASCAPAAVGGKECLA